MRVCSFVCSICEFPSRRLWTYQVHPEFATVRQDGWALIQKCPACNQLWCKVAYEPHSAFPFWAAWLWQIEDWAYLLIKDDGLPYHEWHEATLVEEYKKLSKMEQDAIEAWRRRACGLTPIDHRTPRFVKTTADLQQFLR